VSAGAKLGEREVPTAMPKVDADLMRERPGLLLISDKSSASKGFELSLSEQGITLLHLSGKKEILRPDESMLGVRHLIDSVSDNLKAGSTGNSTTGTP
jgi:hypothetical protein